MTSVSAWWMGRAEDAVGKHDSQNPTGKVGAVLNQHKKDPGHGSRVAEPSEHRWVGGGIEPVAVLVQVFAHERRTECGDQYGHQHGSERYIVPSPQTPHRTPNRPISLAKHHRFVRQSGNGICPPAHFARFWRVFARSSDSRIASCARPDGMAMSRLLRAQAWAQWLEQGRNRWPNLTPTGYRIRCVSEAV